MELSAGTLGVFVVLIIAGFAIGNFMAARPNAHQTRVGDLRLLARRLHLYPKLVAYPDWLGEIKDFNQPMLCQYTLIDDNFSLPLLRYTIKDGCWQSCQVQVEKFDALHAKAVDLPNEILPLIVALQIKANCLTIYWRDDLYQYHKKAYKLNTAQAQTDLNLLKTALQTWGELVQNAYFLSKNIKKY